MEISKAQIEKILKTLPIGYYIKRNVEIALADARCSYYDIMNDKIAVSYPQLRKTFENINYCENIEDYVRCMLYHETSHALLTPKTLKVSDIINIFEDERIETILRHYYKNVDFRSFVKLANNFDYEPPKSAMDLFYQIVRYRIGPKHFLKKVDNLIKQFRDLRSSSTYTYSYINQVQSFYDDVELYFNNHYKQNNLQPIYRQLKQTAMNNNVVTNEENNENEDDEDTTNLQTTSQNEDENDDNENDDTTVQNTNNIEEDLDTAEEEYDEEFADETVGRIVNRYDSASVDRDMVQILSMYKTTSKQNGSAINAYSGKFDPRSVIRTDYKYFVQQNRLGHVKAYSKMHLNLFIDCSGSFRHNDDTVNMILKALTKLEKQNPNFEFDLIACSYGQKLLPKNERVQFSEGGTGVTDDIFDLFKKQQHPNVNNINIVLYDGDMFDGFFRQRYEKQKNIKAFDTANTTMIVDSSNQCYIKNNHLTRCKAIIIDDNKYVSELYKTILIALQNMLKS